VTAGSVAFEQPDGTPSNQASCFESSLLCGCHGSLDGNSRIGAYQSETQYLRFSALESAIFNNRARHKIGECLLGSFLRVSDPHVDGIDDGDAGGEFVEVGAADEIGDEVVHGNRT
jgi:hypothetical protein